MKKDINLNNLDCDIECAVSHLVSFSSDDPEIEEKREILIEEFKNKLKLKEFSLSELIETVRKHEDDFSKEEYYYKEIADSEGITLKEVYAKLLNCPSIIIEYNETYFVLDGQHRINELINLKFNNSKHMLIKIDSLPNWAIQLLKDSYL